MPAAVTITDLTRSFPASPKPALDRVNATIHAGRITGLVGPDGAGKTTLMRLIAGLLKPGSGTIRVFDRDPVRDAAGLRGIIGYMPQKFGLYEDLSVIENLTLHADLRAVVGKERDATFARLLKFTGLAPFTGRLAGKLSGGMKQKLGLACALLGSPRLLLLDEPGVGVDPISRRELWRMVGDLATGGIAIIWSTAYLDEAERCDDVLLLNEGKPLYAGPPRDLTARMNGRCFLLPSPFENRRARLAQIAARPEILDATIQAQNIRILTRSEAALMKNEECRMQNGQTPGIRGTPPASTPAAPPVSTPSGAVAPHSAFCILHSSLGGEAAATAPRFEDAFMDILGGANAGDSALSRILREIPRDGATVIETRDLTRKFGDFTAADRINLNIKRGEIYGLLGPNGAGKSTTFRMLCGLLAPTSGEARAAGIDLRHSPARARQRIGYMAQKFSLYGNLTVAQNLAFFSGAYGLHGAAQRDAIAAVTDCFHLAQHHNAKADTLPLGYKQRLALACAVMHSPDILFLDEPTSGVDPVTRREFWTHINAAVQRGVTVMVTTHFMDEAEYCDRIGLVYRARLIATGTPEDLKREAATAENQHPAMEDAFITLIERSGL